MMTIKPLSPWVVLAGAMALDGCGGVPSQPCEAWRYVRDEACALCAETSRPCPVAEATNAETEETTDE